MRRFRLPSLATITTAAVLLSAASLAGVAGPAQPAGAAATGCPWVGSSTPISQRVSQLMAPDDHHPEGRPADRGIPSPATSA